jgi:hypothetical protein
MTAAKPLVACLILWFGTVGPPMLAQTTAETPSSPRDRIARWLDQLRQPTSTFDPPSITRYLRIRDDVTGKILTEIDAFVAEHVVPEKTNEAQIKGDLNSLLHHLPNLSPEPTAAFLVNLWSGRYLVVGLDIPRIGDGPDDAMWLRAYRDEGNRFVRVAAVEFSQDRQPGPGNDGALVSLTVTGLEQISAARFWFVATARRLQGDQNRMAVRVGQFDGERFTTVATALDIFPSRPPAVRPMPDGGFTIHRRAERDGKPIVERYIINDLGPIKADEWDADSR